jgi:glutathione S-transferase
MKLISAPLSPFAARVRLSIYRKALDIEIVSPPSGGTKDEAFLALNPMGQIPLLVLDSGEAIPESATIVEYIEDVFPTPSLRPAKPEDLARARLFLRLPDIYFENAPRTLLMMRDPAKRDPTVVEKAMSALDRGLAYIDHYIDAAPWAVGGRPSIADSALIPVLNAVGLVGLVYGRPDVISRFASLGAYWSQARDEAINARVIAEQLAANPPL